METCACKNIEYMHCNVSIRNSKLRDVGNYRLVAALVLWCFTLQENTFD